MNEKTVLWNVPTPYRSRSFRELNELENRLLGLAAPNGVARNYQEDSAIRPGDADILTIACEAPLLLSLLDVFRPPNWTTVHAGTTHEAFSYLRYNCASVALVQVDEGPWEDLVNALAAVRNAPEVVVMAPDGLDCGHAQKFAGCSIIAGPPDRNTLVWTVSGARQSWVRRHQHIIGGALCSDA